MTIEEINEQILSLGASDKVDVFKVGESLLGRNILGTHIGSYVNQQLIITGGIHAREYITTLLLIKMIDYLKDKNFVGGIYFVPMVNPDGIDLVLNGTANIRCEKLREFLTNVNNGSDDFSLWKANANAVDLNVNFDALWGKGVQNVFCVAPANFVGYYPDSERENRSLIEFSLRNAPNMTIDYHAQGEVIYYGFDLQTDAQKAENLRIANDIAEYTGYRVERSEGSVGGYQDWSIDKLKVPSVTIEVGNASMGLPIDVRYLDEIFERNKDVPLIALNSLKSNSYGMSARTNGKRLWKGLCVRR